MSDKNFETQPSGQGQGASSPTIQAVARENTKSPLDGVDLSKAGVLRDKAPNVIEAVTRQVREAEVASRAFIEMVKVGVTPAGVTRYDVGKISFIAPSRTELVRTVQALEKAREGFVRDHGIIPKGLLGGKEAPLKVLHDAREVVVPGYNHSYIDTSERDSRVGLPFIGPITEMIVPGIVQSKLGRVAKPDPKLIEVATTETRQEVRNLLRWVIHEVGSTYKVGSIKATEVFPVRITDPLLVQWEYGDEQFKALFEAAFVKAVKGKMAESPLLGGISGAMRGAQDLNRAQRAAEAGGYRLFGKAMTSYDLVSMGQLLFVGDLVYDKLVLNGFSNQGVVSRRATDFA